MKSSNNDMFIKLVSDTHFELSSHGEFVFEPLSTDSKTILVLAGDIDCIEHVTERLHSLGKQYHSVVYVPGNHEFWGSDVIHGSQKLKSELQANNVHFLDNSFVEIGNYCFVGGTMWCPYDDPILESAHTNIKDFGQILYNGDRLNPSHCRDMWHKFKNVLIELLDMNVQNIVAVTHFLPDYMSINERFRTTSNYLFNRYFASNILEIVSSHKNSKNIKYWLHGHTHDSVNYTYPLTNTRVIANPVGYKHERKIADQYQLLHLEDFVNK